MGDPLFLLLLIGIPAMSQFVSTQMRRRFVQFSRDPMPLSGREAAERMLDSCGIHDVQVISTEGQLTDHYDPANKTVNLSRLYSMHVTSRRLPWQPTNVVTRCKNFARLLLGRRRQS